MVLQPSLAAMARQQERQRTCPPPVPPLLTQSHFDSVEAYKDYMRTRRKAQERLREFNRPARKRRAAVKQPSAASLELTKTVLTLRVRERRMFLGVNVETGRKKAPMGLAEWNAAEADRAARRRDPGDLHAEYQRRASKVPALSSAAKVHATMVQTEEWSGVTMSQVRRAVTAANKRDPKPAEAEWCREIRRKISNGLSATRPEHYPALLERKKEARRSQVDAHKVERAHLNAKRDALISTAQWAYDVCRAEWENSRMYGSQDEWYLRARRIEAGYELRDAKAAAAEWLLSQKSCAHCGQVLPQWTRGWDRCECSTL